MTTQSALTSTTSKAAPSWKVSVCVYVFRSTGPNRGRWKQMGSRMTEISLWATAHKQEQDHEAQAGIKTIQAEVWLKLQSAGLEEETSEETAEVEGRCTGLHCPQQFLQDIIKPLFLFRPLMHSISRRCNLLPNAWPLVLSHLMSFLAFLCPSFLNLGSLWNNDSQWHIPMIQGASQRGNHTYTHTRCASYIWIQSTTWCEWLGPTMHVFLFSSPHVMETKFTHAWV